MVRYRRSRPFSGTALVTSLVACQPHCFTKRGYAVYFGETLHSRGYIVALSQVRSFVDSRKARYKWSRDVIAQSNRFTDPADRPTSARISQRHLAQVIDSILDDGSSAPLRSSIRLPVRTSSSLYGFASPSRRVTSEASLPLSVRRKPDMQFIQPSGSLPNDLDRAMVFAPIKPTPEPETVGPDHDHHYDTIEHMTDGRLDSRSRSQNSRKVSFS